MTVRRLVWGLLLGLFFATTLVLSWPPHRQLFVSPDENAAFVFADIFATTGRLAIDEPLNESLAGLLHPRSTVGFGQAIVPASFVGFVIVLGAVGAVFGNLAMYLVTPLLAVLAIVLWQDSVRRIFNNRSLADAAACLLMIHPAFWYYSGRVMMHNVAFLALLIAGLWLCLQTRPTWRVANFGLAGVLFGAALIVRTSEIIWLTLAIAIVFAVYRAMIGWRAGLSFAFGFVAMLGLLGVLNASVYGSPVVNGYTAQYPYAVIVISDDETSAVINEPKQNLLLPFGFHEKNILNNVWDYGWNLYPWMSVLSIIGMMLVIGDRQASHRRVWLSVLALTLGLATWLGVVYGSWMIVDNPDPNIISLGNSHVRYWLPLFALGSLFGARTLVYLLGDHSRWRLLVATGLMALTAALSFQLVFFGHDGFMPSRAALETFEVKRARIIELTEPDTIMIVDRADKYLFPARRVVVPLRSEATYAALPTMLGETTVYYFGITLPDVDMAYLNAVKLLPLGVRIELLETMSEESLYRFSLNP